jgi:succinoglycan biosynthesis protein ExoM
MTRETRIAMGVCTAHRPELLDRCLAAHAAHAVPNGYRITAVIADNEPEPRNRALVEARAATCPFPIRYLHEPRRGISRARNAALDACADGFDRIAFTDDDCEPAPDWIAALLAAAERHGADVVLWPPGMGHARSGSLLVLALHRSLPGGLPQPRPARSHDLPSGVALALHAGPPASEGLAPTAWEGRPVMGTRVMGMRP